jgi:hypothetical protein
LSSLSSSLSSSTGLLPAGRLEELLTASVVVVEV